MNLDPNATPEQKYAAEVAFSDLQDVIEVALFSPNADCPDLDGNCRWGVTLNVIGEPSAGKTESGKAVVPKLGLPYELLITSQHNAEDFSQGVVSDGKGGAAYVSLLPQLERFHKLGHGVVILDDANGALLPTQNTMQALINERHVAGKELPPTVRFLMFTNPVSMATGGKKWRPATANRLLHMYVEPPTYKEWSEFVMRRFMAKRVDPQTASKANRDGDRARTRAKELKIAQGWEIFPEVFATFAGFMERNAGEFLHRRPDNANPQSGLAWPSHRTWDQAVCAYTTARILGKSDTVKDAFIAAAVGPQAVEAFHEYRDEASLPDPQDVLAGKWTPDPSRIDVNLAALLAAAGHTVGTRDPGQQADKAAKLWSFLQSFISGYGDQVDLVAAPAQLLTQAQLSMRHHDAAVKKAATTTLASLNRAGVRAVMTGDL